MSTQPKAKPVQEPAQPRARQVAPVEAYVSDAWFAREQNELFARTWLLAGSAEDLKSPGDYKCVQAGPNSLIVLKDQQDRIRAFHNRCRHRGTRLLEGSGNVGRTISCFYHQWSYDLAGNLTGIPQEKEVFPGIDKSCLGLFPAGAAVWRNLIFVNAAPDAETFEHWLGQVPAHLGPHQPEKLVEVSDLLYRVRANWKIVVENFIDAYHFDYLHPVSLGDGDFGKLKQWPCGRHWIMKRGLKPGFSDENKSLPVISGVPANFGAGAAWLFPNVALYERATFWNTFHVIPVDARHSLVHIRTRAMPSALERSNYTELESAELPRHIVHAKGSHAMLRLELTDVHPLKSDNVMLEDIYACEAVQAGLEMRGAKVGPLSTWEESLTFFQEQVLDYVPVQH